MDIDEFKSISKKKRVSNLYAFKNDIFELHNDGYSQLTILEYLSKNGIETTQQNLSRFLRTNTNNTQKDEKKVEIIKSTEPQKKEKKSVFKPLEKKGKDLELKGVPEWAK